MSVERHYTVQQAADRIGLPYSRISEACNRGELRHVRFAARGRRAIPESALEEWLARFTRDVRPVDLAEASPVRRGPDRFEDLLPAGFHQTPAARLLNGGRR
jgi:excisionase family DNA binding protein